MSVSKSNAQPRSDAGKGASRRLRLAGLVPGIVYGAHKDPEMIAVSHNETVPAIAVEAFYSHILTLNMGGAAQQVVLKGRAAPPSKPFLQHLDLQRISAARRFASQVPFHVEGERLAPGIKLGGVVSRNLSDVEIACLPKDLPEFIEIDVSALEIGGSIHLSEIPLPRGWRFRRWPRKVRKIRWW